MELTRRRRLACKDRQHVILVSRNGRDHTARFAAAAVLRYGGGRCCSPALLEHVDLAELLGSSAAALIGLQFVVVALVANIRKMATVATINAFGTPTVAHLGSALAISAIMTAPWPSLVPVAVALVGCGLGGLGYALVVIHRVRRQTG